MVQVQESARAQFLSHIFHVVQNVNKPNVIHFALLLDDLFLGVHQGFLPFAVSTFAVQHLQPHFSSFY